MSLLRLCPRPGKDTGRAKNSQPVPAPPPDEPKGKMNLWWPPSVPWIGESSQDRYTRKDKTNNDCNDPDTSTNSSIYPGKLCYGEFRLACITSSPSHDQPVHLDLETHSMDNCPEYETASYTWGRQEDDNTKKYPAFMGPYGDVSFHTRNCRGMLRFLRPG